jgi:hypothetical protein
MKMEQIIKRFNFDSTSLELWSHSILEIIELGKNRNRGYQFHD